MDADFSGNWKVESAMNEPTTSKSRTGWVIKYASCIISWASKLQTQTALSTTEAEYIALSTALREQIPLMELLKEVTKRKIDVQFCPPKIYCKAFEDNSGAIEMAKIPELRPRTKHLNILYHHFRDHVQKGDIEIVAIDSEKSDVRHIDKTISRPTFSTSS